MNQLVSIIAIIGVFFVPAAMTILIVWFRNNAKNKRYQLQADLYSKALEKGQSVPTDLFAEPVKKRNPLNTGIICMAAGVGISLFFFLISISFAKIAAEGGATAMLSVASIGVIPFLIGLGFLIIHLIEKKKATNENAK